VPTLTCRNNCQLSKGQEILVTIAKHPVKSMSMFISAGCQVCYKTYQYQM
jgi:hypothetical protein